MVETILRLESVKKATGLGRSTIYDLMNQGRFPKPVKIGAGRAVGWLESEIRTYQQALIEQRDGRKAA